MRVLVLFERSGVVRRAFREAGHDAWSVDLEPADDGAAPHLQCDVRDVLALLYDPAEHRYDWSTGRHDAEPWALVIAHPPCTYLASSGLHWNKKRRERERETESALRLVRDIMDAPIGKVAIENPVGRIGTAIRPADQYIQPWQFGHDASKRTGLWLRGLPKLSPTSIVAPRMVCAECGSVQPHAGSAWGCRLCGSHRLRPRWANQTDSGQNRLPPSADRAQRRAQTYEGIARAMVRAWGV